MRIRSLIPIALLLGLLVGCPTGARDDDDDTGIDDDDTGIDDDDTGVDDDDTGADDDDTGADDDDSVGDDDDSVGDDDDSAGPSATLTGSVTRSATLDGDGIGSLTIGVFGQDLGGGPPPKPIGFLRITNVDFSSNSASVTYSIEGLPITSSPLYVGAFLDEDDPDGEVAEPEFEAGDLVSFDPQSGGADSFTPTAEDTYTLDLDLAYTVPNF